MSGEPQDTPETPPATDTTAPEAPEPGAREAELEGLLKERDATMKRWKQSVKAQLEDAAKKNEALRKEMAEHQRNEDTAAATLRLQLAEEFKGRTRQKDEALAELQERVAALLKQATATAAQHREETAKLQAGAEQEMQAGVQQAVAQERLEGERQQELLRSELDVQRRQAQHLQADLDAAKAHAEAQATAAANADGAAAAAADLRRELTAAKEAAARAHAAAAAEQRQSLQEFVDREAARRAVEVGQRDEQIAVLRSMLHAAKGDADAATLRAHEAATELGHVHDRHKHELHGVAAAAAVARDQAAAASAERDTLAAQTAQLRLEIAALRAESASRELAYNELFETEHKASANAALADAEARLAAGEAARCVLEAALAERDTALAEARARAESAAAEVEGRAAQLEQRAAQLDALDAKVRHNQLTVAQMARDLEAKRPADSAGAAPRVSEAAAAPDQSLLRAAAAAQDIYRQWSLHGRMTLERSSLFQQYKRFLPVALGLLLMVFVLTWGRAGAVEAAGVNSASMRRVEELQSKLTVAQKDTAALRLELTACVAKSGPVKKAPPPEPLAGAGKKV